MKSARSTFLSEIDIRLVSLRSQANPEFALAAVSTVAFGRSSYSPELGRWVNRDPIEEKGGMGLYSFVANHSLKHVDKLGMAPWYVPWRGCCDGKPYNRFRQCCRKGRIIEKGVLVGTGVFRCKSAEGSLISAHRWLEVPSINAAQDCTNALGMGKPFSAGFTWPGIINVPDGHAGDTDKICTEIKVDPCFRDEECMRIEAIRKTCQERTICATGGCNYSYPTNTCLQFVNRVEIHAYNNCRY